MSFLEIPGRDRMVEAAMDAYLDWRRECSAVAEAYCRWADSGDAEAEPAWEAYEAAHASEEHASLRYLELAQRTGDRAASRRPLTAQAAGAR